MYRPTDMCLRLVPFTNDKWMPEFFCIDRNANLGAFQVRSNHLLAHHHANAHLGRRRTEAWHSEGEATDHPRRWPLLRLHQLRADDH